MKECTIEAQDDYNESKEEAKTLIADTVLLGQTALKNAIGLLHLHQIHVSSCIESMKKHKISMSSMSSEVAEYLSAIEGLSTEEKYKKISSLIQERTSELMLFRNCIVAIRNIDDILFQIHKLPRTGIQNEPIEQE